jgi:hypothetical protein
MIKIPTLEVSHEYDPSGGETSLQLMPIKTKKYRKLNFKGQKLSCSDKKSIFNREITIE